jgi:hypothetical protein
MMRFITGKIGPEPRQCKFVGLYYSLKMYMYLHKNHKALAEPLANALREIKANGLHRKLIGEGAGLIVSRR